MAPPVVPPRRRAAGSVTIRAVSRLRLLAIVALAVVALVAGTVALALGAGDAGSGSDSTPTPVALDTPTDVAAGVVPTAGVAVTVGRLEQKGTPRSYLVVAPTTVAPSTPLVVALHGRNATPGDELSRDQLLPFVAAGQAVLVYPVGYQQAWNNNDGCCGLAVAAGLDDVGFVGMVTDAVRAQFALTGPTDLVGFSNGGRLAYDIACRDVTRYDAVATVAAVPTTPTCPQADLPVPLFAGITLDDTELPTHEAPKAPAAVLAGLEATWVRRDHCVGDPTVAVAGRATVHTWAACADGAVLETAAWASGGHIWPQEVDVGAPDATDLLWSFLSGVHQRAGAS